MKDDKSWDSWGRHVLQELQRLNDSMSKLTVDMHSFKLWSTREITKLQVKAGFIGFLAGMLPGMIAILADKLK